MVWEYYPSSIVYGCSIIPKLTHAKYSQSYLFSFPRSHYSIISPITNEVNMYIACNKYHFNNNCFTTNLQARMILKSLIIIISKPIIKSISISISISPFSKDALLYILLQFAAAILHHGCHGIAKVLPAS